MPERRTEAAAETEVMPDGRLTVRLAGTWRLGQTRSALATTLDAVAPPVTRIVFDGTRVDTWDSSLLLAISSIEKKAATLDIAAEREGLPNGVAELLELAAAVPERKGARRGNTRTPFLERIGRSALQSKAGLARTLAFQGEIVLGMGKLLTGKAQYRRADLLQFIQECGAQALPIVTLISVLVGVILAFVGALQLVMFGAEVYVADLVGVGMAVEMGALMTGIIMAGRTGASYAAQLGTMQVNEEIDAMQTMGISPFEFLVLPRMMALILMMPLLCIYSDILGMLGGALVGIGTLDITPTQYFNQTSNAVTFAHFGRA